MSKEQLALTELQGRVYNRFRRALVNLPVYFGSTVTLLPEEEQAVECAFDDSFALCEEMEDGSGEAMLDYAQIDMLAMMAAVDATEQVSPALLLANGERNFND